MPVGKIEKIIGEVGDKASETEAILYKNSIFPRRVKLANSDIIQTQSSFGDIYETFSVDPEGCRDIDDAFHVTIFDEGVEIGVHIADVASKLNLEKLDINFFSSIYLDDGQINMLSDKLTFDEASLGNGEIKRAISLLLNYDFDSSGSLSIEEILNENSEIITSIPLLINSDINSIQDLFTKFNNFF